MTISAKIITDSISPTGIRLTTFQLNELFDYDPLTGILTHKMSRQGVTKGMVAGSIKADGYVHIKVFGVEYYAQRIIWQMIYGDDGMPPMVDHEDGVKHNNRLKNLRAATSGQNRANSKPRKDNRSGIKGVRASGKRWISSIAKHGKSVHLGTFDTPEEASAAYALAATAHHGAFARP